jgi:hypothetical protein
MICDRDGAMVSGDVGLDVGLVGGLEWAILRVSFPHEG